MKLIIEGKAYDTDKATRVTGGDNSAWSSAWWGLYRTDNGTFFKIVVDHDGETLLECSTLTDAQARATLEKHANHLVEQYFGPMPEPGAFKRDLKFSRRTIIAAIELTGTMTHAQLTRFILKLGPDFPQQVGDETMSISRRLNTLIQLFDRDPESRADSGELLGNALIEHAITLLPVQYAWSEPEELPSKFVAFHHSLQLDGFVITDGALRRMLPASLKLPEAEDQIVRLLNKHHFVVAKGHLDQAFVNHADGLWAAANSQIRNFLDGLLDEIAVRIDPSAAAIASGQQRRIKLAGHGFLNRGLNEWDDNGLGFVNGLMKRLHPHGPHPGLSDQDDSTFRLHIVLLTARLLLVRFDTWGKP
ncbi:MAG: hypothetical protein ACLQFI_10010 [Methylocella sp.]